MKYVVIIERAGENYAAYAPDVPTCIATGATPAAALSALKGALADHLELLREEGLPVPEPSTLTAVVEVEQEASAA